MLDLAVRHKCDATASAARGKIFRDGSVALTISPLLWHTVGWRLEPRQLGRAAYVHCESRSSEEQSVRYTVRASRSAHNFMDYFWIR